MREDKTTAEKTAKDKLAKGVPGASGTGSYWALTDNPKKLVDAVYEIYTTKLQGFQATRGKPLDKKKCTEALQKLSDIELYLLTKIRSADLYPLIVRCTSSGEDTHSFGPLFVQEQKKRSGWSNLQKTVEENPAEIYEMAKIVVSSSRDSSAAALPPFTTPGVVDSSSSGPERRRTTTAPPADTSSDKEEEENTEEKAALKEFSSKLWELEERGQEMKFLGSRESR